MQILKVEDAQLVALFQVTHKAPPQPLWEIIEQLQTRYRFDSGPKNLADAANGVIFANGELNGVALKGMALHDDGVVINADTNSAFLDDVLEDLFTWAREHGTDIVQTRKIDRFYRSTVLVKSDNPLITISAPLQKAVSKVEALLISKRGYPGRYHDVSISFECDEDEHGIVPTRFRIERRRQTGREFNIYFCEAPLRTEEVLELLAELDVASQ